MSHNDEESDDFSNDQLSEMSDDEIVGGTSNKSWSRFFRKKVSGQHVFTIEDFSQEMSTAKIGTCVESSTFFIKRGAEDETPHAFRLEVYPRGQSADEGYISVYLRSTNRDEIFASFDMWLQGKTNAKFKKLSVKWQLFTSAGDTWGFPKAFSRALITENGTELLPDDRLTIGVSLTITFNKRLEKGSYMQLESPVLPSLESRQRGILQDGKFTDMEIICQGEKIECHKAILASQSDVFEKMLSQRGFEEANKSTVTIDDMELESLKVFMDFLYTDEVAAECLSDHASSLLVAADKYNIVKLRELCQKYLFDNLSVNCVSQSLVLAHLHGLNRLKKATVSFIAQYFSEVKATDDWNMVKNYPELLEEILVAMNAFKK